MNGKSDFLGKENLRVLFWRLAIPAIVSQIITLIYNIVDRIYIGHISGAGGLALTGLGVCTPLIITIMAFSQLVCAGGGPIMSYAMGEKNYDEAGNVLKTCFLSLLILGFVLTVLLLYFARPLLFLFGASDATYPYAFEYFRVYVAGTICVMLSTGLVVFITAQGMAKVAMITVCSGAIINIILDPVFIWGLNMGIKGGAIATIISQAVSALMVICFLLSKKSAIRLDFHKGKFDIGILLRCLSLGVSPFIMQITESALSVAFNKSLLLYGGDVAVGVMTLFLTINSIVFLPVSGFCQGAQSITSYNYGAGLYDRVAENIKRLIKVCFMFSTFMWAIIMIFPGLFLGMFTSDKAIYTYGIEHIRYFFAMVFMIGLQPACQMSFLALKNAKVSLLLALLRKVILLIPLIFILPVFIEPKDTAVLLAEPVADFIAVVVTVTTFVLVNRDILRKRS